MREECANARRVTIRIQHNIVPRVIVVAGAVEGAAFAPASTSGNLPADFGDIVRTVINELHVYTEN
jgi:hypothetical protein